MNTEMFFLWFGISIVSAAPYNYYFVDIIPRNVAEVQKMRALNFGDFSDGEFQYLDWDVPCVFPEKQCTALVHHDVFQIMSVVLQGVQHTTRSESLGTVLQAESRRLTGNYRFSRLSHRTAWDEDFHELSDINNWITDIASKHGELMTLMKLGSSFEDRDIIGLEIGLNPTAPIVFIHGGIHAREWLPPAALMFSINQLVQSYIEKDVTILTLLKRVRLHIVPILNVDGYEYSWKSNRMWRKTRSTGSEFCVGVDPERNADAGFGGPGSSSFPCSDIYHGPNAFSEIEVKNVADYFREKNVRSYVNIHAYAGLLMTPFGYKRDLPKDSDAHNAMSKAISDAISEKHGVRYKYGPIYETIYPASGSIGDWAYEQIGVKYPLAWEVDGSTFAPPPKDIKIVGAQIFTGLMTVAKRTADEFSG